MMKKTFLVLLSMCLLTAALGACASPSPSPVQEPPAEEAAPNPEADVSPVSDEEANPSPDAEDDAAPPEDETVSPQAEEDNAPLEDNDSPDAKAAPENG